MKSLTFEEVESSQKQVDALREIVKDNRVLKEIVEQGYQKVKRSVSDCSKHRKITLGDGFQEADEKIVPLVEILNQLEIRVFRSCESSGPPDFVMIETDRDGYLKFINILTTSSNENLLNSIFEINDSNYDWIFLESSIKYLDMVSDDLVEKSIDTFCVKFHQRDLDEVVASLTSHDESV